MTGSINLTAEQPGQSEPAESNYQFGPSVTVPAMRPDLVIVEAPLRGRRNFVVKDPISLKYYRWGERERRLAELLDGTRAAGEVLAILQREFPDQGFEEETLQLMMNQFLSAGLLVTDGTVAQTIYHRQSRQIKSAKLKTLWLSIPGKLISFKITLFDPDLLLLKMNRVLGFLWSWQAVVVLTAMLLGSVWLLSIDTGGLAMRMPDLLGLQNIVILWFVLIAVKIVHEFGHGLACKRFGGEVHEMGALFILFSPFLFCNATDSWLLRDKWKRVVVNVAGMYLELFLAAVAAALWVLTQPGIFNHICFNVMMVCSVMTVFFNANPLMKFDGYYVLSDLMEVPNLKERGDRALVGRLAGLFTGGVGIPRDPLVEPIQGRVMLYAVASYVWTFLVAYGILRIIGFMLAPYGLDRLAQLVSGFVLSVGIVTPLILVGFQVVRVVKSDEDGFVARRVMISSAIFLVVLAVVCLIPVPITVKSALVVDSANRVRVTAPFPGFVRDVQARDSQKVEAGQILARIESPQLETSLATMRLQHEAARIQESTMISDQQDSGIPAARALTAQFEVAVNKYAADHEAGFLRSPKPGTVVGRGLALKQGEFLEGGELFCEIIPEGPMEAVVALSENEASLVVPGQPVSFRLRSLAVGTFHGSVVSIAPSPAMEFPHESLGQHAGGTVPSMMAGSPQAGGAPIAIPSGQIYKARVAIDNPDGLLRPGMSGRIRISCGKKPLGAAVVHHLRNMIRKDFQL